jgi:hypothetical protein
LGGAVQLWTTFAKVEQRRQLALLLSLITRLKSTFLSNEKSTHVRLGFCRDAGSQKSIDDGFF